MGQPTEWDLLTRAILFIYDSWDEPPSHPIGWVYNGIYIYIPSGYDIHSHGIDGP